jgi:hypothetical protein
VFIYDFILGFQIRYLMNTRIIFPPETDSTNENITIVGKKENVDKAKAKFEGLQKIQLKCLFLHLR